MKEAELIKKGAIYIEKIQRGMSEYHSDILHLNEKEAYIRLKKEWQSRGADSCFADFYYFFLEEESRAIVREHLTEEELLYLESLKEKTGEGDIIFPMDEMLLRIIVKLNAREILFSTVYFVDDASTWWGNYKEEYIVFTRKNKKRILLVDDSVSHRCLLSEMLRDEYEIVEVESGMEAIAYLSAHRQDVSLVLVDVLMQDMDGFEVLTHMHRCRWIEDIPVIMASEINSPEKVRKAYDYGVSDFISPPYDVEVIRHRVDNTIRLYAKQRKLEAVLLDQLHEKERSKDLMINILSHIVESRNGESGLHVLHISRMTEMLLERMDEKSEEYGLSKSKISMISMASALHDIGKISIPEHILNKPGRFTPEEFEVMKQHAAFGASLLTNMGFYENEPLVKTAYEICRWHHERFDGNGYPDGLKGNEIPLSAQVVAIADVYDALTSERCYKKAIPHEKAMEMILREECGCFNPVLLECLQEISDELQRELQSNKPDELDEEELREMAEELMQREEL